MDNRDITEILNKFIMDAKRNLGDSIRSIIVYGSYARGDYTDTSDIDIMILVDISEEKIKLHENAIIDCAFDLEMEYGKCLSPIIKNQDFFDYWADTLPFYRNIKNEGVRVA